MSQACGTSLQAAMVAGAKIATGQIDVAIAPAGTDTTSDAPIVFGPKLSKRLVGLGRAKDLRSKLALFKGLRSDGARADPRRRSPSRARGCRWASTAS